MSKNKQQFRGFAKAVIMQLTGDQIDIYTTYSDPSINAMNKAWQEEWEGILAQAAYDLVEHTIVNVEADTMETPLAQLIAGIPDMPVLPEEK